MTRRVRLEDLGAESDGRRYSPSARRNRDEILGVLAGVLPDGATVLEVAAGTGEHAVHMASALPSVAWLPAERDPEGLASIDAWRAHAGCTNLHPPVTLDIGSTPWDTAAWPVVRFDAVIAINLVHITPWSTALALLSGAAAVLQPEGRLFLYGAYFSDGHPTAPSNIEFDERLRETDPEYGVRRVEALAEAGAERGLHMEPPIPMPNNNFAILLRRTDAD